MSQILQQTFFYLILSPIISCLPHIEPLSYLFICVYSQNWREAFVTFKWTRVIIEVMKALSKNETWKLVPLILDYLVGWLQIGYHCET